MAQKVFSREHTAEDVAREHADIIRGRIAIVTGANSGFGYETARVLAGVGAKVFVTCRTQTSADATAQKIREEHKDADVAGLELELGSFASIRNAAETFLAMDLPLHILINNAGIMAPPKSFTKDGFEMQFGVNYLGHFLFTNLLLNKIKASAPSRIVNVSSIGQYYLATPEGIFFDDLNAEKSYDRWTRYAQSKLANALFSIELQRRMNEEGVDVTCTSLHPGGGTTGLTRQPGLYLSLLPIMIPLLRLMYADPLKSIPQCASTQVYCAVSPNVVKGEYYTDNQVENAGRRHPLFNDPNTARKLWEVSEQLINSKQ